MKYLGLDIESVGLKPYGGTIWIVSYFDGKKMEVVEDCMGVKKLPKNLLAKLADASICKIIHSSEFDIPYLNLANLGVRIVNIWDSKLAEEVILGVKLDKEEFKNERLMTAYSSNLKSTLKRYGLPVPNKEIREQFIDRPLGKKFTKEEIQYAKDDVRYLLELQKAQEFLLTRDQQMEVGLMENKTGEKIARMRTLGIGFDSNIWLEVAKENESEFKRRMVKLPREVSNWNSEKQVKAYFRNRGIDIPTYKELNEIYLTTKNKTLGDFIAARELHKSVTSYGRNWFEEGFIDPDGRVRAGVTQIINTGRMSMNNPNLQQLPGEGNNDPLRLKILELVTGNKKRKPQHRRAFVPRKGYSFVIGDFSGQEIGIMAAMSGEKIWIEAMLRGEDIHALTAYMISSGEWDSKAEKKCTFPKKCDCPGHKKMRDPAKTNNFMLAYGGGAEKFAKATGLDKITARAYVAAHKRVIPKLTRVLALNGQKALDTGVSYSADPYRRRRVLRGREGWQIVNQGKNNPIQAAGANMLKLAMISLPDSLDIVLVIHDEIILEVKNSECKKASKILQSIMEQSADYITGIKGLIKVEPRIAQNLMKK